MAIWTTENRITYSLVFPIIAMNDLRRLLRYVRPHWVSFLFAFIAMALVAFFEMATGALLIPIFNQFVPQKSIHSETLLDLHRMIPQDDWVAAWTAIAAILITITIGKGLSEYFSSFLMAKIGQSAVLDLRRELYDHLLKQPASFFEKHRTNYLVSRLVVSCAAIEQAVSMNLRDVLRESLVLIFLLGAAFYLNWRMMIAALVIGPIIALLTVKFSKALRRLADETYEGNKLLTDTAQETLSNNAIVKAYRAEDRERHRFDRVARIIARANLRSGRIAALSPPVIETIGTVMLLGLLFFGLREINSGRLAAPEFFAFLYFLFRSYDPMRKISRQHNELNKAFAAAKDVWDVLDEREFLPERDNAVDIAPLKDKVELRDVVFRYQSDQRPIIDGVSIEIPKGSVVALVGESGSGKSSLVRLIQRFFDPNSGSILWDGIDLRDAKLDSLHRQIALVTQETVLFNDTVRYNISYGNPDATDEEIAEAARIAFADRFINELPEKYETRVGERGTLLSGGQRQRIAIARAVLVDAPVLILDEATSALDTESERLVQQALENLMANRTSIVIAHRLSTVRKADVIVVMDKGRVIETGTHEDLLEKNGKYRRLYELQFQDHSPEGKEI